MNASGRRRRLLVVVPHEERRAVMHAVFTDCDFDVESVGDIDDAMKRIGASVPDALIADVTPGKEDSFLVLREVRESDDDVVCDLPVIISTGRNRDVDRVRAWELQCDGFVPRPHYMNELLEVLHEVLQLPPPQRIRRREEMFTKVRREVAEKRQKERR